MTEAGSQLIVGIGDIKVGKAPSTIKTTLGSCIAVCLYNTGAKAGGMLHLMLPSSGIVQGNGEIRRAKYADTGIEDLFSQMKKQFGLGSTDVKAKIFGGAKMLSNVTQDIGKRNEEAVRAILKEARVSIIAHKTGGDKGYQIDMSLETGKVTCRILGQEAEEF